MKFRAPPLALVLLGDRLVAAAVQGSRLETFTINAEQPATTLRAELDQRHLAVRTVALGLPRTAVTVKPIELPDVAGELHEMVRFELERHLPFTSDDASFDFVPLRPEADAAATATTGRRVLIAAAERRLVDTTLRLAEETRLRPISLTVAAHDLPALVGPRHGGRVVWVHRVGESTTLLFLASGEIALSRAVPTADDEGVAAEIQQSLAVTRWRGVDAVWQSGDGDAPGSPTASALTRFGAPVTAPPYTPKARALLVQITEPEPGAAQLALAVAVATGRRARPLQLLPAALRPRRFTRQQLVATGALAAAIVLAITALLIPGYRENRRLATIEKRLKSLDGEARVVEQTLQELERKQKLLAMIGTLQSSAMRPMPVLRELTDLLPTDAWLQSISLDIKGVELSGQAGAASALISLLENSPRLERVEFASPVTRGGANKEQFRIRASWEGPPAPAVATTATPPRDPRGRGTAAAPSPAPTLDLGTAQPRRPADARPPARQ